jgi:hypothetical protein
MGEGYRRCENKARTLNRPVLGVRRLDTANTARRAGAGTTEAQRQNGSFEQSAKL